MAAWRQRRSERSTSGPHEPYDSRSTPARQGALEAASQAKVHTQEVRVLVLVLVLARAQVQVQTQVWVEEREQVQAQVRVQGHAWRRWCWVISRTTYARTC